MVIRQTPRLCKGFTLVEVLLSTAIIAVLILILVSITGQTSATWRYTTAKIEQFRESRDAFETITTKVSQATLNTYWDYDNMTLPKRYERRSELRFISGPASSLLGNGPANTTRVTHCVFFHAPLGYADTGTYKGLEGLLNVWGYYLELNSDKTTRPAFVNSMPSPPPERFRFRLMEFMQPSDQLLTYSYTSGSGAGGVAAAISYQGKDWFKTPVNNSASTLSRPVAENIIALIITPRLSKRDEQQFNNSSPDYSPLSPDYSYDSSLTQNAGQSSTDPRTNPKNQLPPVVQITMVAIDETSAARLNLNSASGDIFSLSSKFSDTTKYTGDLKFQTGGASLENTLISMKVNYRIFTSNVPIRAAKWSRDQTN